MGATLGPDVPEQRRSSPTVTGCQGYCGGETGCSGCGTDDPALFLFLAVGVLAFGVVVALLLGWRP